MKRNLKIFGATCTFVLVTVCSYAGTSMPSKFLGELISLDQNVDEENDVAEVTTPEALEYEQADLSNAILTISYETTSAKGLVELVTFYEGPYQEEFEKVVPVSEPTEVTISLRISEDSDLMLIRTVMGTGSDVRFAYLDRQGPNDQFLLIGSTNQVLNLKNRFSVSGDLNFLGSDTTRMATVYITASFYTEEGHSRSKQWGPVLLKNGKFLIEGEIERPVKARFDVDDYNKYWSSTEIIIEPRGEIVVSQLGNQTEEISAISGFGYHALLIESWQQDKNYIALLDAYATEYDQYRKRWAAGEPEPETSDEEDAKEIESEKDASDALDSENMIESVIPAEGCEDAVAEQNEDTHSSNSTPKWLVLSRRVSNYRDETLRAIAEGDGDPIARYLAIDLKPYDYFDPASELAAIQPLVDMFDEQFIASNLTPRIENLKRNLVWVNNDAALVPGQKVPEFTLANYDGEDVTLYDVLAKNDMVLIDFWASDCGPCIADFPHLKALHSAYADEDFEIVGVSIDTTEEAWKDGVDENDLPWINLGEVKGWDGPVSTMYGVNAIPKGFLVDSQGCIYKKDIRPAALKEFLVDRYGVDESLEEPEEEMEDSPEASS